MEQSYIHPAFPQPDDQSMVIWRYMGVTKFKWLVNFSRLYMGSADQLGDPFEGTTPEGDLAWWRREAENASSEEHRNVIEYNRKFLSQMAKGLRNQYYVSCWSMNQYENQAMWKCYTMDPKSVAIRTTYATLRGCLPKYVEMGVVRYIDYSTERLPDMNLLQHIMHKDVHWSFEREVRAVALSYVLYTNSDENLFESEVRSGVLVYAPQIDPTNLIQGVVLHPDSNSTFEAEITEFCEKNRLPRPEQSRSTRKPVF